MEMRAKEWVFVVGLVAAGATFVAVGCDSGNGGNSSGPDSGANSGGSSALGESCTRTADCQTGLACIANTCYPKAGGGDDGGSDATVPADGEAGTGAEAAILGPPLGQTGDSCQTSQDCAAGLRCAASTTGLGVCSPANYGLTPTGKVCTGECAQPSDCCELPLNVYLYTCSAGNCFNYTAIHTCQDILQLVLGGDTSQCAPGRDAGSAVGAGCFYYQTYCQCAANTWACNGGACAYTAPCSSNLANSPGGCPSLSRTRTSLATACDMTAGKCQTMTAGCATSAQCSDAGVADTPATCVGGDCTCYQSGCYLKCAKDLDCQAGYSCDTTTSLCVRGACTKDQECAVQLGNVRAKCASGTCSVACSSDRDCSPPGGAGQGTFNGTICDPTAKTCVPAGCVADVDCAAVGGVRAFCVAAPDAGAKVVHSAITN